MAADGTVDWARLADLYGDDGRVAARRAVGEWFPSRSSTPAAAHPNPGVRSQVDEIQEWYQSGGDEPAPA
jgi:hypothetical protein